MAQESRVENVVSAVTVVVESELTGNQRMGQGNFMSEICFRITT